MATAICMAKATESNMTSRIIPGISLRAFWDLGESGWKAGMDENIWRLSFLVQSRVLGVVETLPPGPTEGDRYILNNVASPYDQHIMVFDQALWVPIVPEDRFVVFNTENDSLIYFNLVGNTWISLISPEAIKEAYESNPNTNEFTDIEKAKLADIEDEATADMTAEEIKAAYESNPNTNAFTDVEKAKLSGLSSSRFLGVYPTIGSLQSSHPAPAEGSFGYVDGGPLLDILCYIWDANSVKYVLQASAGGMETPETIKTKYESNEDTNAFTDAEKEKLALFDPDEPGPEGPQGQSAYAVAVANGFVGTEVEWLASLIGPQGDNGEDGANGKSAYEIAIENGFVGTISEWLVSLIGSPGTNGSNGTDGIDGNDGTDGLSAYQVAVVNGFVGTEAEWLASLVGAPGTDGTDGIDGTNGLDGNAGTSAYDVAVANGFVGDEAAWLLSLKGADGADGTDGVDGRTVLYGTDVPTTEGVDGDFYIRTTTHMIYGPKSAGVWPAGTSLVGPAGTTTESITIALSDLTSAITIGNSKESFRMPYAFTLTEVRAQLFTAQTSGSILTVDINENGTSILSTKLTIDNGEKTSVTAVTDAVISDAFLVDDAEITFDIDQIGSGARGLKIMLIGYKS